MAAFATTPAAKLASASDIFAEGDVKAFPERYAEYGTKQCTKCRGNLNSKSGIKKINLMTPAFGYLFHVFISQTSIADKSCYMNEIKSPLSRCNPCFGGAETFLETKGFLV
jgi:hypothetical protein